jgi:hypothetical protein
VWDEGWDAGVGRYSSIYPNCRILIENPLAGKAGQKNWPPNVQLKNFSMKMLLSFASVKK